MVTNIGLSLLADDITKTPFSSYITETKDNIASLSHKINEAVQVKFNISVFMHLSGERSTETFEFVPLKGELANISLQVINISDEILKVTKQLSELKKAAVIDVILKSNMNDLKRDLGNFGGFFTSIYEKASGFVSAQSDILQAQGEIKSLRVSSEDIEKITIAAKSFSNKYVGATAPEFIRASYDIKSSISNLADSGIADFTRLTVLTGIATKSSATEMTNLFAKGYGIFREEFSSDEEFANKFSNAISTSVQTLGQDIPDLIQGLSIFGKVAKDKGVSLSEQLAVFGVSKNANGYKTFLTGIDQAQEALQLNFTDSEGVMLPIANILESIKEKYGDTIKTVKTQKTLKAAFGSEAAVDTLSVLIEEIDTLRISQKQIKQEMVTGTKTDSMAKAMQMGKELQLLKNQFDNFSISIGSMLYPAFSILVSSVGGFLTLMSDFIDKHQTMANVIGCIVGGLLLYISLIRTVILLQKVWSALSLFSAKQVMLLHGSLGKLTLATRLMAMGQWLLNASMLANPVGIVIAGISTLITLGIVLYKNWETAFQYIFGDKKISAIGIFCEAIRNALEIFFPFLRLLRIIDIFPDIARPKDQNPPSDVPDKITQKENTIEKYYGSQGLVAKSNSVNNGGSMTYSPQITVQGNANREDIEIAVNGGMKDFERNMDAYNNRKARLSYAGGD